MRSERLNDLSRTQSIEGCYRKTTIAMTTKTHAEPQSKPAPAAMPTQRIALPEKQSGSTRPGPIQRAALRPPANPASMLMGPGVGGAGRARAMRAMQGSMGNARISRMLATSAPRIQRACACGGEAGPDGECAECKAKRMAVQRQATEPAAHDALPPSVTSAIQSGGGQPLDRASRAHMEPALGADFGGVRLHTTPQADRAARDINAKAFTTGQNIFFAAGQHQPGTQDGDKLLAHELTHTIQQGSGASAPQAQSAISQPGEPAEQEAETIAQHVVSGAARTDASTPAQVEPMRSAVVQRQATNRSITPAYAAGLDNQTLQADLSAVRRALLEPSTATAERVALQENLGVLESEVRTRNPSSSSTAGQDLDSRLATFKQLVLTTARLRLAANRSNLAIWRTVVVGLPLTTSTARAIQAAQIQQTAGHMGVGEWDVARCLAERNPIRRDIYCGQLEGRYRACTGCHLEQHAARLDAAAGPAGRAMWGSLAANLTGIPDRRRSPFDFQAPGLSHAAAPDVRDTPRQAPTEAQMRRINEITATYRSIIAALGSDGYQVWTDSFVNWDSPDLEAIRADILSRIDRRQSDYLKLMGQISAGDHDYLEFQPILQDLRPLADADVQQAVADEIKAKQRKGIIESILVGIATIGLLLLTIFPPTTAIGVAGLAALEAGLGTYAVVKGAEMFDQGYAYSLATGANDVYTREQQSSGGAMMLMGFINVVTGPLMMYTGALRGAGAVGRIAEAGATSALTPAQALAGGRSAVFGAGEMTSLGSGTVRQGRLILSYEADGTVVGIVEGNPNVIMIARSGEAVMYERTAEGGLQVVERMPLPPGGAPGGGGPSVPFESPWPLVPQRVPNWCGAACGEMAAGRLGVEVTQEQVVAIGRLKDYFDEAFVINGKTWTGGFQAPELAKALEEAAPVGGRQWIGGQVSKDMSTPAGLQRTLNGFLESTESSVILRVDRGNHWIVVDEITSEGLIAIRDPGREVSTALTAEELHAMWPTGDAVISMPKKVK